MSRPNPQRNLPPMEVRKSEQGRAVFRKSEQERGAFRKAEQAADTAVLAAELFDAALQRAGLNSKEVAHLLGISESLVQKMRSTEQRGCPSFAQLLRLPPRFHIALHREMNDQFGFGRAALGRLLEAAGDLALAVEQ
jgi:ribosome-binding protein aMBF1 (putative translation factor)